MPFDVSTAIPIKEANLDGLHEQGGRFDITTARPVDEILPNSRPNFVRPDTFSWQLAGQEVMAQAEDFFNAPARFLGLSNKQPKSMLATETLPEAGRALTEPMGDITIPTFSADNVKKLFKGDFNFDTIELSPTPLEVGINVAGAGIPAARQLSYNINRNMLLNNLINTEKVRGALIESMPAFDELIGSKLPKEFWADLSMEQKIAVIGQQAEKNPQVGQLVKGLSTGEIKPMTAPETPATPQAGENVNFVNPEGIQKAGVIEGVEGNRVAINLEGKTIIAPINQISPYIQPEVIETPQNPLPQAQGEAISPENALYAEARKYKSAEEFIKAQGEPVYHGTPTGPFDTFDSNLKGTRSGHKPEEVAFHFTDNRDFAQSFSQEYKTKYYDKLQKHFGYIPEGMKAPKGAMTIEAYLDIKNPLEIPRSKDITPDVLKKAQEEGYDAIITSHGTGTEYVVFNPEQIKTKSQLTDIWNKAQEKPTMPQVEGEGTLKTRGLAQGVEAKAIENKLTDSFGALPEYRSIDIKQQASKAQEGLLKE